jgi:hypothetical protein
MRRRRPGHERVADEVESVLAAEAAGLAVVTRQLTNHEAAVGEQASGAALAAGARKPAGVRAFLLLSSLLVHVLAPRAPVLRPAPPTTDGVACLEPLPCTRAPSQVRRLRDTAAALRPDIEGTAAAEELEALAARMDGRNEPDSPRAPSIISVSWCRGREPCVRARGCFLAHHVPPRPAFPAWARGYVAAPLPLAGAAQASTSMPIGAAVEPPGPLP